MVICIGYRSCRLCINFALLSLEPMRKLLFTLIFAVSLVFTTGLNAQCPMCKTALKSNKQNGKAQVGNGINQGILFLMAMPYVLVGAAGVAWYNNRRKKNA